MDESEACGGMTEGTSDTIFALSSGTGATGVAVIRLSGSKADVALAALTDRPLPGARRAVVRRLHDPETREVIDEGLVIRMPGPGSFTGEDVVELHVHGSPAVVRRMLSVLAAMPGLRMADPGEFTRRAFENGRLSLMEVEGLADLVRAETEAQRRQALAAAQGEGRRQVEAWRERLVFILSRLEAAIDFCEEADVADAALEGVAEALDALLDEWTAEIARAQQAESLREGFRVVIAGPPNAGKSSLLNALAGREAAIVSDVAGTTRDVIEVRMDLGGLPVILSDTAGLRADETDTPDAIERIGMKRARQALAMADVVIWLVGADQDAAENADSIPQWILPVCQPDGRTEGPAVISVLNKVDLIDSHPQRDSILSRYDLAVSARSGKGLATLERRLASMLQSRMNLSEPAVVTRERQRQALIAARDALDAAKGPLAVGMVEVAAENVRRAVVALERLIGRVDVEDLLNSIFAEFCIGK